MPRQGEIEDCNTIARSSWPSCEVREQEGENYVERVSLEQGEGCSPKIAREKTFAGIKQKASKVEHTCKRNTRAR